MLTQTKPTIQVCSESTPKIWARATTKANVGDIIHAPFTPVMEVTSKYVYTDGRVWLKVKPKNASCYSEEWILDKEEDDLPPQPKSEEEQGQIHGQLDATENSIPIYTQASCQYSKGYLEGYNGTQTPQQPKTPAAPLTWSVTYDDNWQFYRVWVGNRAIGRASTHEEAERIAQKYIATGRLWQEHRERVLASYSD